LLVALLVGVVVFPLVSGGHRPLFVFYMNVAPYAFIIVLWISLVFGGVRSVAMGGVVIFVALIAWGTLQTDRPLLATIANLAPYVFIIALWIGMLWALPALGARAFRRNPMYQGDFTMELTDEEIRCRPRGTRAGAESFAPSRHRPTSSFSMRGTPRNSCRSTPSRPVTCRVYGPFSRRTSA
jgi:hypothetical protein